MDYYPGNAVILCKNSSDYAFETGLAGVPWLCGIWTSLFLLSRFGVSVKDCTDFISRKRSTGEKSDETLFLWNIGNNDYNSGFIGVGTP